ncbi:MAG: hypothetical protein HHJ11_17910 [Phycicoccus sp.]|nr:hypothetical protein [Phycicoccus sp.]NMM34653.1 hypothetical protein [Phycicoccus sp.]
MSDELTRLLSETLHSRVDDVESMPNLTANVLRKGRSARNRRLALGWGAAGVVAVAAVVAVALVVPGGQRLPAPAPANSGMPSSPATSPAAKAPPEDALMTYAGKLPMGPPIGLIPRAEKRGNAVVVVTADHVVTLPHAGVAYDLTPSSEGLVVSATSEWFTGGDTDPDQALYLIRPSGSLTTLHHGPFHGAAVDPTGKKYAIAEIGERLDSPVNVVTASLSDPGKTRSHSEAFATNLLGWTTAGLLLSGPRRVVGSAELTSRTWLWEPAARSETEIPGVVDASVMPTDPGRLLVAGQVGPNYCLHLFTVRGGQMGPVLTCGSGNGWVVSPDGRRAAFGSTAVDLATGSVGPELMNGLGLYFPHWEDSTHVLSPVRGSDPQGQLRPTIWVRCDVTSGACEQAPIPASNGTSAVIDW